VDPAQHRWRLSWEESAFEEVQRRTLMSAARLPSGEWLAVGAFGRVLRSVDDGKSWQPHAIPGLSDWHLNSISGSADGKQWLITGEAGTVLRSDDGGASWSVVPPFYKGSIYGAVQLASGTWVAYGMRGNVHFSQDGGRSWRAASVQAPVSTYGHAVTEDGRLLLAGQGGIVLASQDQGTASRSSARKAAPASPASTGRPTAACCSPATAACSATSRPPAAPTRPGPQRPAHHHRSLLMTHHAMTRTDALVAFLARMLIAWRRLGALFLLLTLGLGYSALNTRLDPGFNKLIPMSHPTCRPSCGTAAPSRAPTG
jgi:hypothetical protein